MEYYSAIKNNEFESAVVRWMKLDPVIQSEVSQKEKNKQCILARICGSRKMISVSLFAGKEFRRCSREWTVDTVGGGDSGTNRK